MGNAKPKDYEEIEVYDSCGCVFCDLGLEPDYEFDGMKFHTVREGSIIGCTKRESDET